MWLAQMVSTPPSHESSLFKYNQFVFKLCKYKKDNMIRMSSFIGSQYVAACNSSVARSLMVYISPMPVFNDGSTRELMSLTGTVPVSYRGTER